MCHLLHLPIEQSEPCTDNTCSLAAADFLSAGLRTADCLGFHNPWCLVSLTCKKTFCTFSAFGGYCKMNQTLWLFELWFIWSNSQHKWLSLSLMDQLLKYILLLYVGDSEDLTFQVRLGKDVFSSSALSVFFVLTGRTFKCIFRQLSYDIFNATVKNISV